MAAIIQISQATGPASSGAGFAYTGGVINQVVTVASVGTATSHEARILNRPTDDVVTLAQVTATTWTFTPNPTSGIPDGGAAYRIELVTDRGLETESKQIRVFGIRDTNSLLIPPFGTSADPLANIPDLTDSVAFNRFLQASELNEPDVTYPNGNPFGWHKELRALLQAGAGSGGGASGNAGAIGAGSNLGALLWEWDKLTLDGIDSTALNHERMGGTTPTPNAETAMVLDVYDYGAANPGSIYGNVLRVVSTALAGGGMFRFANTITLPDSYVVQMRLVSVPGTSSSMDVYLSPMFTDSDGVDNMQAVTWARPVGFSGGNMQLVVDDRAYAGTGIDGSGNQVALMVETGGVLLTCTVHKRQAGETPSRAVVATREDSWGASGSNTSPTQDGAIPSDDGDVGANWDGVDLDKCGFGAVEDVNNSTFTFHIASLGVYERPAL